MQIFSRQEILKDPAKFESLGLQLCSCGQIYGDCDACREQNPEYAAEVQNRIQGE